MFAFNGMQAAAQAAAYEKQMAKFRQQQQQAQQHHEEMKNKISASQMVAQRQTKMDSRRLWQSRLASFPWDA